MCGQSTQATGIWYLVFHINLLKYQNPLNLQGGYFPLPIILVAPRWTDASMVFLCCGAPNWAQIKPYTRSHKHSIEGNNHLPHPAGYTLANTTQNVIGFLCFRGKLLTDFQLVIKRGSQVFFCKTTFYPACPQPVLSPRVYYISGAGLCICVSFLSSWFLSWLGFFLFSTPHWDCEPEVNMVGIQKFQDRLRCDPPLLSQLCNQGIHSHSMTILYKKCIQHNITSFTLPSRLLLPILLSPFRNSEVLFQDLEMLFREKEKSKPSVHLLSVFLALCLSQPYFFIFPLSPRQRQVI